MTKLLLDSSLRAGHDWLSCYKRGLKTIWAQASFNGHLSTMFKSSFFLKDPLVDVLRYLILREQGAILSPFIPYCKILPVSELVQLALLWAIAGEEAAAKELAQCIPVDFPWLWCREDVYREEEARLSIALLQKEQAAFSIEDPFFAALYRNQPKNRSLDRANLDEAPYNDFSTQIPWSLAQVGNLQCAWTWAGERTSLGALISPKVQVRSLGPQIYPLSEPLGFGIRSFGGCADRRTSLFAMPVVWCETNFSIEDRKIILNLSFVGLECEKPIAFSFYVKADEAEIGQEKFRPQSLLRYLGGVKPVVFEKSLKVESSFFGKMELIPLAGKGCFWDCEFLIAFEISASNPKGSFSFSLIE